MSLATVWRAARRCSSPRSRNERSGSGCDPESASFSTPASLLLRVEIRVDHSMADGPIDRIRAGLLSYKCSRSAAITSGV